MKEEREQIEKQQNDRFKNQLGGKKNQLGGIWNINGHMKTEMIRFDKEPRQKSYDVCKQTYSKLL